MDIKDMESAIEAMLFAAGEAVTVDKIAEILNLDVKTAKSMLTNMEIKYSSRACGIMIRQIGNKFQMFSKPEYGEYIKLLFPSYERHGLSEAAYEALAIVAYSQPVTRARVEEIRGVNSDGVLAKLVERNLIEEAGRLDAPGRPLQYKTTEEFIRSFGLRSLSELPDPELFSSQSQVASLKESEEDLTPK